jgi:hypothetical protein
LRSYFIKTLDNKTLGSLKVSPDEIGFDPVDPVPGTDANGLSGP